MVLSFMNPFLLHNKCTVGDIKKEKKNQYIHLDAGVVWLIWVSGITDRDQLYLIGVNELVLYTIFALSVPSGAF